MTQPPTSALIAGEHIDILEDGPGIHTLPPRVVVPAVKDGGIGYGDPQPASPPYGALPVGPSDVNGSRRDSSGSC
jgi:hypothetical protein